VRVGLGSSEPRPKGHNRDSKPLIDTGALRSSVTSQASGTVREISSNRLRFGTAIPYAAFHQHGTGRIPARPFLGINDEQAQRAVNLLRENLIKTLGSHAAA